MRFQLLLAISIVLLIYCQNSKCQEAGVDEPTTKKPGFFSRLFGKGSSSSTTTTTTTPRNVPAAVPTPARQPPNRVQQNPNNPFGSSYPGQGSAMPHYPKPNQQPSGLSLSYGPTPPPRGVHPTGSRTPLAPMAAPAVVPNPAAVLTPGMTPTATTTSTSTTTTTTVKPKQPVVPQAPVAKPAGFSDFEDPKKSISPTPLTPSTTTTTKSTVKEDFPALPAPRRPSIKEDFPALPSRPSSPGSQSPTPASPSAWGTIPPSNDNRVAFVPHVPASTTTVRPGSATTEKSLASDDEIQQLTETLYNKETNSQLSQITVNIQGKTRSIDSSDEAPQPLLQVDDKALQPTTIAKMRDLFNNYEIDTTTNEHVTPMERKEENDFVDSVMATNVMRQAMLFLQNKGIVSPDPKTHRDLVKSLWFTLYSRGQGKIGSSGFEHVFVNEVKNGTIIGLHNWVYFNEEEKAGRIDYKGYLKKLDLGNKGMILKTRFTHNGLNKPVNTLFVGTSPELELALYTVCFELRADKLCPVSLGGNKFSIQTYSWRYRGKNLIGSAYPEI